MSEQNPTMNVEYREVPGHPLYRVGNDGSLWKYIRPGLRKRAIGQTDHWQRMKGYIAPNGYLRYRLPGYGKPRLHVHAHSLVLTCFAGERPEGMQACHNNGVKSDNRISNLRWDTPANNTADNTKLGVLRMGMKHGRAKLTDDDVRKILRMREAGMRNADIAAQFNISEQGIYRIVSGQNWTHITSGWQSPPWKRARLPR